MSDCPATFSSSVPVGSEELKVYRCDWGWYVRAAEGECRSRFLDEAFEVALGRTLDREALRGVIETLDRELTAERERTGAAASRTLSL